MRIAALLVLSWLLAPAAAGASPFAEFSGRELYQRFCASCHGLGGSGDGPVAPSFKVMLPDLTEITQRSGGRFPEERVRRIIDGREAPGAHGMRDMPVWGQEFWLEQGADEAALDGTVRVLDRLVEYLRSIQR
jgi:mono/diheme cytochrome c family protein